MDNENIGKAMYGIIDNGVFGVKIVCGIVVGVRYTEDNPIYEIAFGSNSWKTKEITSNVNNILTFFNLASLERVKESHGLQIKYKQ